MTSNINAITKSDLLTAVLKGTLGSVPIAGSLIAELVGVAIPNQRLDRLSRFAENLEEKLIHVEALTISQAVENGLYLEVCEEAIRQAVNTSSNKRREYLCNFLSIGIKAEDSQLITQLHLLRLLAQLNEIEVVWLRYHAVEQDHSDEPFRTTHATILKGSVFSPEMPLRATKQMMRADALQYSYLDHLRMLNLLRRTIPETNEKRLALKFNRATGDLQHKGWQITEVGEMLLEHAGLIPQRTDA